MRLVDVMLSLPTLFVILVASKFLGNGTVTVVIVIFGLFSWMGVSRLVRSLFLSIREREFVEAAQRRRRDATGGSSSATSCPTPSARSSSRRR